MVVLTDALCTSLKVMGAITQAPCLINTCLKVRCLLVVTAAATLEVKATTTALTAAALVRLWAACLMAMAAAKSCTVKRVSGGSLS